MNEEKQKIIKILRSLIISNPREGTCVKQLMSDFKTFEGFEIPFFEHRNIVDFLRATNHFIVENVRGEFFIYAKTTTESEHITKLVAKQNKPRTIRELARKQPPNNRFSSFHNNTTKRIVNVNNTQGFGRNFSMHEPRHRDNKNMPTTKISSEQRHPQSNYEKTHKNAPTAIEFTLKQLQTEFQSQQPEKKSEKNSVVKDVVTNGRSLSSVHTETESDQQSCSNVKGERVDEGNEINNSEVNASGSAVEKYIVDNPFCSVEHKQLNELELPWEDEYWSLFVTCCRSTAEIWGKLFGKHCRVSILFNSFQIISCSSRPSRQLVEYLSSRCNFVNDRSDSHLIKQ